MKHAEETDFYPKSVCVCGGVFERMSLLFVVLFFENGSFIF